MIVVLLAVSPFLVGVYVMNQLRHLAGPVEGMVRNQVTFEVTGASVRESTASGPYGVLTITDS